MLGSRPASGLEKHGLRLFPMKLQGTAVSETNQKIRPVSLLFL